MVGGEGGHIRVVLADDTREVRILLRLALETHGGFEIVGEADDGDVAIDQSRELQPDLVLLDLAMPRVDGLAALPEIRRVAPDAKVVVLSGLNANDSAAEAISAGAHAYVEKGASANDVINTLLAVVSGAEVGSIGAPRSRPDPVGQTGFASPNSRDVFSVIVHELMSPLTVVQGFADTLDQRLAELDPDSIRDAVQSIGRAVRQARAVVEALAEAERVEVDSLSPRRQPVDVSALVRDTIGERPVGLVLPGAAWAEADPVMIGQAVENLLGNALKFAPQGARVSAEVHDHGDHIDVVVTDDGPGIPLDRQARLFTKFGRLAGNVPGMGLGLYIARGIARAHGGELRLAPSTVGARFVLSLPAGNVPAHDDG